MKATTGKVSKVALKSNPEQQYNIVSQEKEKVLLSPANFEGEVVTVTTKEYIKNYSIVDIQMNPEPEVVQKQRFVPGTKLVPEGETDRQARVSKEGTKSDAIRKLLQEGKTVAQAAKETNSHYSFVWGIAQRLFKGNVPQANKTKTDSLSQKIRDMYDAGKSKSEIKKALLVDYSFVYSVVKAYELKLNKNKPIPTTEAVPEVQEA